MWTDRLTAHMPHRYMNGAGTNPDLVVFAHAAAQVKKAMDVTLKLGGENYVFWGCVSGCGLASQRSHAHAHALYLTVGGKATRACLTLVGFVWDDDSLRNVRVSRLWCAGTDAKMELENMAEFLRMAVNYKKECVFVLGVRAR